MNPKRIRAVLLDMGGVLIPELRLYDGAAEKPTLLDTLERLGAKKPRKLIIDAGQRLRSAYRELDRTCTQPDVNEVLKDLDPVLRKRLLLAFNDEETLAPYSGVRMIVQRLAQSYRLGLASNTILPGDHHAKSLRRAGILQHFDAAVWSSNFGYRKPDPAILFEVLDQLRLSAREAIFVGDKQRTDVAAANRAGVISVWLRRPGKQLVDDEPQPDFIIQHLAELFPILNRH